MNEATAVPTTAGLHGPRWGERAEQWAEFGAGLSRPAWGAVADAAGVGDRTRALDVGCGSGEFCGLAAARGAVASGVDAAEGMIEVARRRFPGVEFQVGPLESLPWRDGTFDLVTGFNAFQFAADLVAALAEARRVARPGGLVAICNWGRPQDCGLFAVLRPLRALQPPAAGPPAPDPPPIGVPGVLEELARAARLFPRREGEVDVPLEAPDRETLVRALLSPGSVGPALRHAG